jgi:hypothetical protein
VSLATVSVGLDIFRARLETRLYLWEVGEIDDLPAAIDELLVDVFHYATAVNEEHRAWLADFIDERADAITIVDDLMLAWRRGGDRAFKQPLNAERLRQLSDAQLAQLERRIKQWKEWDKEHGQ